MYILTILSNNRTIKTLEFFQPPTSSEIENALKDFEHVENLNYDIARDPIEERYFFEHEAIEE